MQRVDSLVSFLTLRKYFSSFPIEYVSNSFAGMVFIMLSYVFYEWYLQGFLSYMEMLSFTKGFSRVCCDDWEVCGFDSVEVMCFLFCGTTLPSLEQN